MGAAGAPARPRGERRRDPDDGNTYTLEELRAKFQGAYPESEIAAYFEKECVPLGGRATAEATSTPPPARPGAKEAKAKNYGLTLQDWLTSMDESGFLTQ